MEPQKKFRFEVNDPATRDGWVVLFEIVEEELPASLELRNALNEINSPIVLRIVDKHTMQIFD